MKYNGALISSQLCLMAGLNGIKWHFQQTKMKRPTIRDVASAAGVSVTTVNRVLGGADTVKRGTVQQVYEAAVRIGYHGLGAIHSQVVARKARLRFGFLLLQPNRTFYKMLGAALQSACHAIEDHEVEAQVTFAEDLAPQLTSNKLLELGQNCNAIGVVSAVHPLVMQAVNSLEDMNVPVVAMISQLAAAGSVNYVGLDNWKVGRTSAWLFQHYCRSSAEIGILVGNHRYRCQEMNEAGFRSYFREFAPDNQLLEPISTFETAAVAAEMTEKLLCDHPDLMGLYISGGGISGAMSALRTCGKSGTLFVLCHELTDNTRAGLLDGTLTMVISHPLQRLAQETVNTMMRVSQAPSERSKQTTVLPFDIYTRENI